MPFNASGTYTLSDTIADATPASAIELQAILDDIQTALNVTFLRDGTAIATGQFLGIVGATPQYSFSGDTNTGFGSDTADVAYVKAGGIKTVAVSATGETVTGTHDVSGFSTGPGHTPVGGVIEFAGASAPTGWLICDGASLLRASYPALFTAIGTAHGAVDGTHFSLPDCTGRVVAGKESSATRLTTAGSGVDGGTLGAVGGAQTVTLDTTMIPSHNHSVTDSHTHTYRRFTPGEDFNYLNFAAGGGGGTVFSNNTDQDSAQSTTATSAGSISINNTGGGAAHNNAQPTIVLNKIIFAGV